ncbi:MAG: rhodanese-like domain-containing protein [Deltaproteobacteria bacterium]|nr:rhodanese-like domain-containing protein [Deltaproteobacteria bacterium]
MTLAESTLREAIARASRAQADLDKRVFHLKTLHDVACELSGLTQPRKIMETFLLTAMGLFGATRGLAILMNAQTRQGHLTQRGLSGPEADACERNLARIAEHYLPEDSLPCHAEFVLPGQTAEPGLLPADTAVILKQRLDGNYALLSAIGPRLSGESFGEADMTALLNLAGTMANALAQNLFHRQIQHLSAGLIRQGNELQDAQRQAGRARATLDRQIFHLQTLYEFTAELSPLVATDKLLEAFLLMVMGTFGASRGCVLLCDRQSGTVRSAGRGIPGPREWTLAGAEKILYRGFQATEERRLAPMSTGFILDPPSVFPESELGFGVHTAALFTVDDTLLGMLALGPSLSQTALSAEARELLRGLTANCMVFLKNARAFETIQTLNADLARTNADLRQTITDLTEARHRIRGLEFAKSRLKQLIQRETERAGGFRAADMLLMAILSAVLALAFNYSSPNGIPVVPEAVFQEQAPRVDVLTAHELLTRGEAVLVDARPPELFQQKHIAEAVNIPAPLFDVIYPMQLGRTLKPEQTVFVYGRTISKRYDEDVTQRLLQRHDHVRVLEGGVAAWEEKGFPVAP